MGYNLLILNNAGNSCKRAVQVSVQPLQIAGSSYESKCNVNQSCVHLPKNPTLTTSIGFEAIVDNKPAIKLALGVKNSHYLSTLAI